LKIVEAGFQIQFQHHNLIKGRTGARKFLQRFDFSNIERERSQLQLNPQKLRKKYEFKERQLDM
jgi:hypothetical protein